MFVVVTDPLHVAWYGTWVTTPTLATSSGSSSTVAIKTEVQNNRAAAVNATLKTDIVDKDGKVVATISSQQQIAAGKTVTFDQTTPAISNPSLWHPDHPTMYRALSSLSDGTGTVDEFATPFGFRWFSWSASQGFSLNGAHYWMQGANLHQDHAGWGNGVSDAALYRDVKMVKDAGMNFIRVRTIRRRRPSRTPATSSASCSGRRITSGVASAVREDGPTTARIRARPPISTRSTPTSSRASRT